MYVIGGWNRKKYLSSIEFLTVDDTKNTFNDTWQIFKVGMLTPRKDSAVCPVSTTSFIVMGGNYKDLKLKDIVIVYTEVKAASLVSESIEFSCTSNSALIKKNHIISLVQDK